MRYEFEIQEDNSMQVKGLYGNYDIEDNGNNNFLVSVNMDMYVPELNESGDEYLVKLGEEWKVPVTGLTGMNSFIKKCEAEALWNYLKGPLFRIKIDNEKNFIYLKGNSESFMVGEDENKLYVDHFFDQPVKSKHNYVESVYDATQAVTQEDDWWNRDSKDISNIIKDLRYKLFITSSGNIQIVYKDKLITIGNKDDESYWINILSGSERHIYYKQTWNEVLNLIIA